MYQELFQPVDGIVNKVDKDLMTRRPCPICGAEKDIPIVHWPEFQYFCDDLEKPKQTDVHQVQCRDCSTLYMNPCYNERGFAILFELAGMSYGASAIRRDEQLAWMNARQLLPTTGSLLDVGCYHGDFLAALPEGMRTVGVDIDSAVIERARLLNGGPRREFHASAFEKFHCEEAFDTITMFHVLEHLPNPVAVLERLRQLARPQTRLVVEVPVLESAKTNDINGFLTVSHLTHFSVHSLNNSLRITGWQVDDATLMNDYNGYRIVARPVAPQALPANPANAEDSPLLYEYLAQWYTARARAERLVATVPPGQRVIWGGGFHTELIYQFTRYFTVADSTYHIVDKDPLKQGRSWRGIPITAPQETLGAIDWTHASLLISSYGHQEAIAAEAERLGVPADRIYRIYDQIRRY